MTMRECSPDARGGPSASLRAAIYARVSTTDQTCDNQLGPLRAFIAARGWVGANGAQVVTEHVDHGVSGAKESRPALDALLKLARRRQVDCIVITKLDRLARSVHHLLTLSKELESLGVGLVVLDQALDTTTPSGRLLFTMLGAVAEFERDLIRDRVVAGMRRARAQGKHLGRPRGSGVDVHRAGALLAEGLSLRAVGRQLGTEAGLPAMHPFAVRRAMSRVS